jgi:hypothetical protein
MPDEEIRSILERIESISRQRFEEGKNFHLFIAEELGRSAGSSDVTNKSMVFLTIMLGVFAVLQIFLTSLATLGIWYGALYAVVIGTAFIISFYLAVLKDFKK